MAKLPPITRFSGEYHFLSNFYPAKVVIGDVICATAEHAFQAQKAAYPSDRLRILDAKTPGLAKKIGRNVLLRHDWEDVKVDVMKQILRYKFRIWVHPMGWTRNPLSIRLIQTGDAELIEGNTWGDTFWGQCPIGNGENMLGKLLMKVRGEISHGK